MKNPTAGFVVLFALFLLFGCQNEKQENFSFIAIVAEDFDRSLNWYRDNLGFELINKSENAERQLKQANLALNDIRLEIIEIGSAIHPSSLLENNQNRVIFKGIFKAGFSIDKFDETVSVWQDNGIVTKDQVVTDPISDRRMVILRDPDGNRIQIFEK